MVHDVAIIGAGPCGLAVAARLRELTPSALFTDDEHARYWRSYRAIPTVEGEKKRRRRASKQARTDSVSVTSMIVLDAHSNGWMSSWRQKFRDLKIEHLRSPMFFHPDPRDRDGMLEFAHSHGRAGELQEIHSVVGKELSKHRAKQKNVSGKVRHLRLDDRDRIDYFAPSSVLFDEYCDDIVERYRLEDLVVHAEVENIDFVPSITKTETNLFELTTSDGTYWARIVVVATGPGTKPCIPVDCGLRLNLGHHGVCHCFDNTGVSSMPEHVLHKVKQRRPTCVMVVGGGLTSAQIVENAIKLGISKVLLILRGRYKLKHFDVDLEWVSKLRNQQMSIFWSADSDEERFELLRQARNGGSITPRYDRILSKHTANGRLEILTNTSIHSGTWSDSNRTWSIELSAHKRTVANVDHVVYATGTPPNIDKMPFLQSFRQKFPVESVNGLPKITGDLMWNNDVPLFMTGGLAGLRLGPGAANLAGARQGAERIAWRLEELARSGRVASSRADTRHRGAESPQSLPEDDGGFTDGSTNKFQALMVE